MAIIALNTAASGLSSLSTELDVIANNLANVNNKGFKTSRVNFEDLVYQERAQPGVENSNGDMRPAGTFIGLGTRVSNTQTDFSQGSPIETGQQLDMMIQGNGFFQVSVLPETGNGIAYTRSGNFFLNADGDVVLGNSEGPRLEPAIHIDPDVIKVEVSTDGRLMLTRAGSATAEQGEQIQLATFINPAGLKPIGGNLYIQSDASGDPIVGNPGEGNRGTILQKFLEASNVDPVTELVSLIKTQRAFEMNSQTIQSTDQVLQVISNLGRT